MLLRGNIFYFHSSSFPKFCYKNVKLHKINVYGPYVLNIISAQFEYKVTRNSYKLKDHNIEDN